MPTKTEYVFVINDPVVGLGLLRTAKFCGYTAHVIARTGCRWLRWAAACKQFVEVHEPRIKHDLLNVLRELGFDESRYVCLAAGDAATQALMEIAPELSAKTQHSMDAEARRRIGNKATFSEICESLKIPTPLTWVVNEKPELIELVEKEGFSFPVIVKAVNMSGSIGIRTADDVAALNAIVDDAGYDYAPLVVQEYIEGYDIGFCCLVKQGQIRLGYTQKRTKSGDSFPRHEALESHVQKMFEAVNYSGPANIDARIDEGGNVYVIECNARFWATSHLSYLLGIDLIAESHQPARADSDLVYRYDGTLFSTVNALLGLFSLRPMGSGKAKRYLKTVFADLPAFVFTKVPASRKFLAF